jgi:aspartate kinase
MALIVQKYGGTSIKDIDRIRNIAKRIKETRILGNDLVIVLSARSGVTNRLITDAKALHPQPDERELDMLLSVGEQETIALMAIALHALKVPAVSRTGAQIGLRTDNTHTQARILKIKGGDIKEQIRAKNVVIIAGFQGISQDNNITTLGRGGSDLSAIAIASAINADICQIYTDVDGVYTADPNIVPNAQKIDEICYDEMLELAGSGSKVIQSRAVEFAKNYGVVFEVRSSFNQNPGTIVKEEINSMEKVVVRGVAMDKNQVKIVVSQLPDQPGTAAKIFTLLADSNVNVDMIVQNIGNGGLASVAFTVPMNQAYIAEKTVKTLINQIGTGTVQVADPVAKLSVVGVGMKSHCGVASTLFSALAQAGINIQLISTSEIKISVAINSEKADTAYRVAHDAFLSSENQTNST